MSLSGKAARTEARAAHGLRLDCFFVQCLGEGGVDWFQGHVGMTPGEAF